MKIPPLTGGLLHYTNGIASNFSKSSRCTTRSRCFAMIVKPSPFSASSKVSRYHNRNRHSDARARLSALKESTSNSATGKRVVLPLPGGPATMTIRGRAKSAPEVSVCVLAHVFGKLGLQEVATLVDDALTNHLRAF
jgi:hypothetical protein